MPTSTTWGRNTACKNICFSLLPLKCNHLYWWSKYEANSWCRVIHVIQVFERKKKVKNKQGWSKRQYYGRKWQKKYCSEEKATDREIESFKKILRIVSTSANFIFLRSISIDALEAVSTELYLTNFTWNNTISRSLSSLIEIFDNVSAYRTPSRVTSKVCTTEWT